MERSITIKLPADVSQALDDFIRQEGRSQDDVVGQAVKEHLFLQRFRSLQERMIAKARGQGILRIKMYSIAYHEIGPRHECPDCGIDYQGFCAELLEHCVSRHEIVSSETILAEVHEHLAGKFKYSY